MRTVTSAGDNLLQSAIMRAQSAMKLEQGKTD